MVKMREGGAKGRLNNVKKTDDLVLGVVPKFQFIIFLCISNSIKN